jgi:ABC-type sugar transport system permease subunit/outer membrane protein assembly factor BamB
MKGRKYVRYAIAILLILLLPGAALADGGIWTHEGDAIESVAVSGDGSLILIGSRDNNVYAYSAAGDLQWTFETAGPVVGLDISADKGRVAVASEDRNVYLLDRGGTELWRYPGRRGFNDVSIADDGSLVAAVSDHESVVALSGEGQLLWENTLRMPAEAVATYGTGDWARVLVGNQAAETLLYARDGSTLLEAQLDYDIHSIDATADGAYWVVGSIDNRVYLLDGTSGEVRWSHATGDEVWSVAISADGQRIIAGSEDTNVYLLNLDGEVLAKVPRDDEVTAVGISDDGSVWIAGTRGGIAELFGGQDLSSYNPVVRTLKAIGLTVAVLAAVVLPFALFARFTRPGRQVWEEQLSGTRRLVARVWRSRVSYLFLLPTILLLFTFSYYPFFSGFYHAFTTWKPGIETKWVGLYNFKFLLSEHFFWVGVKNIGLIVLTSWVKALTMPLIVAELIFHLRSTRLQYWARTMFVVPLILPGVVNTLLWRNIYDPNIGLANQTLELLGLSQLRKAWLGDPSTALWALIFIGFPWAGAFQVLVYYGGLISIPNSIFDAAQVDGATGFRRFLHIDLPLIAGQIKLLLVLSFIGGVQVFQLVFLTTGGGPGSATYTPVLEMYYQAMRFDKFGIASAMGVILFIVIMLGTLINIKYMRSSTEF